MTTRRRTNGLPVTRATKPTLGGSNKRENPWRRCPRRRYAAAVSAADPTSPPSAPPRLDRARLAAALHKARTALLAERGPHGHWEGELSSSALSTATAVTALELWQRAVPTASSRRSSANETEATAGSTPARAIEAGLQWLAEHQNADGGWGDTTLSFSNISTTALCWAAFGAVPGAEQRWPEVVRRAEAWLAGKCLVISNQCLVPKPSVPPAPTNHLSLITNHSPLSRPALISAIIARYGKDRTFSVPILTMCALAGRLGEGKEAWRRVIQLPFELAALPHKFFAALRLPVVSYALPALIAIGQVRHHHLPTRNPVLRLLRNRARAKTLRVLERIQPPGGGFLEATPLTSFVTMSLAGSGHADHPVAQRGVEFLLKSMRADGSWPIDTNLATWVTTLAVNALGPSIHEVMSAEERGRILDWLLGQQYRTVHPYTNAAPGGWAWTDLPGGVPDADDTAGALLALKTLTASPTDSRRPQIEPPDSQSAVALNLRETSVDPRVREAAIAGVKWLLDLQNRDGGIPTFCRGWTNLPFDRSSPDITAHALRAWLAWLEFLPAPTREQTVVAICKALRYLVSAQSTSGAWIPLWFGNQHMPNDENHTYGTTRVLGAFSELIRLGAANSVPERVYRQLNLVWLAEVRSEQLLFLTQRMEGSWAGGRVGDGSVEETALSVEALVAIVSRVVPRVHPELSNYQAALRGEEWLVQKVEDGTWTQPAPIGFYFAKLWYYERLYPLVFTVAALEAVARLEPTETR